MDDLTPGSEVYIALLHEAAEAIQDGQRRAGDQVVVTHGLYLGMVMTSASPAGATAFLNPCSMSTGQRPQPSCPQPDQGNPYHLFAGFVVA